MAILEEITANMELTESKKFKLQKAILTLMLEWKHLEEYMDSSHHSFRECIDELQRKEEELNSVQESVIESNKELDSVRVSIEERMKELEDKERELNALRDEFVKELDLKEEKVDLMGKSVEERIKEIGLREQKVKVVFEEFRVEEKRFEEIQELIEGRMKELDGKEREFNVFRHEKVKELGLKEEQLDLMGKSVEERIKEVGLREEKVKVIFEEFRVKEKRFEEIQESRMKELDDKEREFNVFRDEKVKDMDLKEEQLDLMGKSVEERIKKVGLREVNTKVVVFEEFSVEKKRFEEIQESRMTELDDKEKEFNLFRDEKVEELELREKQLEERIKQVDLQEEKVKVSREEGIKQVKSLEDIQQAVWERMEWVERVVKELHVKEKEFGRRAKELEAKGEDYERRTKELSAKEEDFEKRRREECKEKEPGDPVREIDLMGMEISNVDSTNLKMEVELEGNPDNSSPDIQFYIKMDGKGLQSFLNQREKDHHLMAEEVYRGLQLSSDPAKLVLDAMEGFYPTDPNNGEIKVVRKSCILLLEQLQRISPQVRPEVKAEAVELSWRWRVKLRAAPDSMEVLGHLYLSASYCLPVPYSKSELLGLFEIVAEDRQAPELCRILGLTDSVPDLIRNLVRKNQILVAVRFVSEFGLVDEFPPALLLKDHVKQIKRISKMMLKSNKSCKSQNAVIDKRVAALREVIRCIVDHKLESVYSTKSIEQSIEHFLRQKEDDKGTKPQRSSKTVEQEKSRKEYMSSINSLIVSDPPATAPRSLISVGTKLVPVTDLAFILANMDAEHLLFFLNGHFEDHELMRNEVLLALQHSFDPARLVLNAIRRFHLPYREVGEEHFEDRVIRASCILLLEQLMKLPRHLLRQVKGEVTEIAHQWNLKILIENGNPQVILGFLQFIATFRLTSFLKSDELLCLLEKIAPHPHAPELCQLLGYAEKNPGCVLHPHVITEGSSLENVPLNKAVDFENVNPEDDSNSLGVNTEEKSEVLLFRYASDPAKLVLDAIRGCYHSILAKGANCSNAQIMDKFSSLLEKLMGASPEIKSQVQEAATAFSVDWKSKLSVSRKNQAEVKAFAHLLATYNLDSSVMFEVLHRLLKLDFDYENKFKLYRHLNFFHKTPDFIQYLIENDERLLAIRFIYEFKLVEKFPPGPILNSHVAYIEKLGKKMCEKGNHSPEALDKAADKEVALLKAVIKFQKIHGIECDSTPEKLQVLIDQIRKQREDRKVLPTSSSMAQEKKLDKLKKRAAKFAGQLQEEDATKRPRLTTPPTAAGGSGAPLALHAPTWQYGPGGMAPLGWQYIPDASTYQMSTIPYLYRLWQ